MGGLVLLQVIISVSTAPVSGPAPSTGPVLSTGAVISTSPILSNPFDPNVGPSLAPFAPALPSFVPFSGAPGQGPVQGPPTQPPGLTQPATTFTLPQEPQTTTPEPTVTPLSPESVTPP